MYYMLCINVANYNIHEFDEEKCSGCDFYRRCKRETEEYRKIVKEE